MCEALRTLLAHAAGWNDKVHELTQAITESQSQALAGAEGGDKKVHLLRVLDGEPSCEVAEAKASQSSVPACRKRRVWRDRSPDRRPSAKYRRQRLQGDPEPEVEVPMSQRSRCTRERNCVARELCAERGISWKETRGSKEFWDEVATQVKQGVVPKRCLNR